MPGNGSNLSAQGEMRPQPPQMPEIANAAHEAKNPASEPLDQMVTIPLTASMAQAVDDYFHNRRFRTRSAALRDLIALGLKAAIWQRAPR